MKRKINDWLEKQTTEEEKERETSIVPTSDLENDEEVSNNNPVESQISDIDFEGFQATEEETIDPFVFQDEEERENISPDSLDTVESHEGSGDKVVLDEVNQNLETSSRVENFSEQWEDEILPENSNSEWIEAFQDLQDERREED
jgi:hypothetical protein